MRKKINLVSIVLLILLIITNIIALKTSSARYRITKEKMVDFKLIPMYFFAQSNNEMKYSQLPITGTATVKNNEDTKVSTKDIEYTVELDSDLFNLSYDSNEIVKLLANNATAANLNFTISKKDENAEIEGIEELNLIIKSTSPQEKIIKIPIADDLKPYDFEPNVTITDTSIYADCLDARDNYTKKENLDVDITYYLRGGTESNIGSYNDVVGNDTFESGKEYSFYFNISDEHRNSTEISKSYLTNGPWDGTKSIRAQYLNEKTKTMKIFTPAEMKWLSEQVNSGNSFEGYTITLMNDLDLGAKPDENGNWEIAANDTYKWTPIGTSSSIKLKATFDGNNKTISGVYVNRNDKINGIFGVTSTIKNLTIKDSYIKGTGNCGGIVGAVNEGCIENCHNINTTVKLYEGGAQNFGGIVGQFTGDYIKDCTNTGSVICDGSDTANSQAGGIVGRLAGTQTTSKIENCTNKGNVIGNGTFVGGIGGTCKNNFRNCRNEGNVTSNGDAVGGIAGKLDPTFFVINSSNIGNVEGSTGVGGIIGQGYGVNNCYNTGNVTGKKETSIVGGILGGYYKASSTSTATCNIEISYCYNSGNVTGGITNTTGLKRVGGICGSLDSDSMEAEILYCYNKGNVYINSSKTAGSAIAGYVSNFASITQSYYLNSIVMANSIGGIADGGNLNTLINHIIPTSNNFATLDEFKAWLETQDYDIL